MRCLIPMLVLLAGISSSSFATLIERDLSAPGDGLLTYDDVHRREWLDLTETSGWDLATLDAALSAGSPLSAFKLATLQDVQGLATSAGVVWEETFEFPGANGPAAWDLIDLIGELPLGSDGEPLECSSTSCIYPDYDDLIRLDILEILGFRLAAGYSLANSEQDLTIAAVFSYGEPAPLNHPIGVGDFRSGGITSMSLGELNLSIETIDGPYWLYRTVPEPSSLAMLLLCSSLWAIGRRR